MTMNTYIYKLSGEAAQLAKLHHVEQLAAAGRVDVYLALHEFDRHILTTSSLFDFMEPHLYAVKIPETGLPLGWREIKKEKGFMVPSVSTKIGKTALVDWQTLRMDKKPMEALCKHLGTDGLTFVGGGCKTALAYSIRAGEFFTTGEALSHPETEEITLGAFEAFIDEHNVAERKKIAKRKGKK